jgi:hypothetical protein
VIAPVCVRVSPDYMNQDRKWVGCFKISATRVLRGFRGVNLVLGILRVYGGFERLVNIANK